MFLAHILQAAQGLNTMSYSLTIIIKPQKLSYFWEKIEYYQPLIYFRKVINLEKLAFDAFI